MIKGFDGVVVMGDREKSEIIGGNEFGEVVDREWKDMVVEVVVWWMV